jgi:hypothetical protein
LPFGPAFQDSRRKIRDLKRGCIQRDVGVRGLEIIVPINRGKSKRKNPMVVSEEKGGLVKLVKKRGRIQRVFSDMSPVDFLQVTEADIGEGVMSQRIESPRSQGL